MKHTLLAFLAVALLAACNSGKENSATNATTNNLATSPATQDQSVDNIAIPESMGHTWLKNYHKKVGFSDSTRGTVQVSFMMDAKALRKYLDDSTHVTKLDVYLAQDSTGVMRLLYIGSVDSMDDKTKTVLHVEHPYYKTTDTKHTQPMIFDMTMPCPQCLDRIRMFSNGQIGAQRKDSIKKRQ